MNKRKILGVYGGLGPMSSVYFYEMLTSHTKAECDQDHIDILLSSRASTPDRTAFILGKSGDNPLPVMQNEIERLCAAGAEIIAIPCNTAHFFYRGMKQISSVPLLNIIEETVSFCKFLGLEKVGVLATEGTVSSGAYKAVFQREGIEYICCGAESQKQISNIIYGCVKKGKEPDIKMLLTVADSLFKKGCEKIILGCTELSLIKKNFQIGSNFIDSLEVLAAVALTKCGADITGFDSDLTRFTERKEG